MLDAQNLTVLLFIAAAVAAVVFVFVYQKWQTSARIWRRIRTTYGKRPDREYDYDEFDAISHYSRQKQEKEAFYLDDITWNDLEMDTIFMLLNHTWSSIGESYLYHLLRTPVFTREEVEQRNRLITYFQEHPKERENLEYFFANVGKTGRYSVFDFIYNMADYAQENPWKELVWTGAVILMAALIFLRPEYGILGLIVVIIASWSNYYKKKKKIEPYIMSCSYLLHILKAAKKLEGKNIGPAEPYLEVIRASRRKLSRIKRNSFFLVAGSMDSGMSGGLEKVIVDYLNFTFHIDLMQFAFMVKTLRDNLDSFEELTESMGILECATACASFREMMQEWCVPEFSTEKVFSAENMYHPMIQEPVKNSISVEKGVLLTGSNASGKSTFLKTAAINAVLAQTIGTCMADRYGSGFFRIYSSMALRDDLTGQESYYIVEIKSLKRILDQIGGEKPVLCFIDEVLRGTNTVERIAASSQILKSMGNGNVLCFAATHDVELTHILEGIYENYHFQEEVQDNEILFDYKLYQGRATSRNAIRLLHIMGYADDIIRAAEESARYFMEKGTWKEM